MGEPAKKPRADKPITGKQEAFAVAVAKGMTASAAYLQAYDTSGMTQKTVRESASRLLRNHKVAALIQKLKVPALRKAELSVERTLLEIARVAHSDIRRLLDHDGTALMPDQWDDDIAAAVASVEFDKDTGRISRLKLWDKSANLGLAARHLGLFEKDNAQRRENLAIQINLVGAPDEGPRDVNVRATLVDPPKANGHLNGNGHKNGSHE